MVAGNLLEGCIGRNQLMGMGIGKDDTFGRLLKNSPIPGFDAPLRLLRALERI